jgi:hypothetical protein
LKDLVRESVKTRSALKNRSTSTCPRFKPILPEIQI